MAYGEFKDLWNKWLSSKRFDKDDAESDNYGFSDSRVQEGRSPFEADIGRVVFSQPFRRLAGKTQVHPFADVDYIHNRLTHSTEVGYVASELGKKVATFILKSKGDLQSETQINEIGWICQAAGLMHDIGNPPYGHAGEDAIRAWASQSQNKKLIAELCGKPVLNDLMYFDGNAQAFRMAVNPKPRETCYYKLTVAVLGALVKYPFATNSEEGRQKKKSAAFSSEEAIFKSLWDQLGLKSGQRHPLSYVTEAADDICYRISDFEDAVIMGIMDENEVKQLLMDGMSFDCCQKLKGASLQRIKAKAIGDLINEFAAVFERRYDDIVAGNFQGDLRSAIDSKWSGVLAQIKIRYDSIFSERRKVITEIGAYGQFERIFGKYLQFLTSIKAKRDPVDYRDLPFICQRLVTLAWGGESYYVSNMSEGSDWWAHAVLDFVVGMTDSYLYKLAAEF